jgi:HNH endonuclease
MASKSPSHSDDWLKDNLRYEPDTGHVFLMYKPSGRGNMNKPLGAVSTKGYLTARIKDKQFRVHRLAWFLHYDKWPDGQIDHINGDKLDNRISNLRDVTNYHNCLNKPVRGKSRFVGICKIGDIWRAVITVDNKKRWIGRFTSEEEAALAYNYEALKVYGPAGPFNQVFEDVEVDLG